MENQKIAGLNGTYENETVQQWRAAGKSVVGYSCLFTPVELLDAAGVLPYRIRALGNPQTDLADARLSRFNCSFCRACLQLGLDGTYDFLDGIVETNGCDQLRGMFENWVYANKPAFFHYLKVPHIVVDESIDYFELELRRYRAAIEEHFHADVTDGKLWDAMAQRDRIRDRLGTLHAARERSQPALSGADALAVTTASAAAPPALFEEILDEILGGLDDQPGPDCKARLLLGGSATDELDLLRDMESLGGIFVADTLCFGTRINEPHFGPRDRSGDPIRAMAELYLKRLACPRMYDEFPARLALVLDAVERADIDGVLLTHNKFCDIHGIDNALLRTKLEEREVPVLILEKEYGAGAADRGRIKTRMQAFLERIGDR